MGGIVGTGGSGSKSQRFTSCGLYLPIIVANAVRYGTAKAEWFLNVVRFSHELSD